MGLDLYATIEDIFLDERVANKLWDRFIKILHEVDAQRVLDVGCGGGEFCKKASKDFFVYGVDLSSKQVKKAKKKGCNCKNIDVCELNESFDVGVAIFDVVNYLSFDELKRFFACIEKRVDRYFIFDMNSLYAMEELAVGTLKSEKGRYFGVLDSEFIDNRLITNMTLFKKDKECYKREDGRIEQFYHSIEAIKSATSMKIERIEKISLYYEDEVEKYIIVLKK